MDIFKIEPGSLSGNLDSVDNTETDLIPEVSFDAGAEFNLNFFDTPEDSNTQGGFSNPESVESVSASSPPSPVLLPQSQTTPLQSLPHQIQPPPKHTSLVSSVGRHSVTVGCSSGIVAACNNNNSLFVESSGQIPLIPPSSQSNNKSTGECTYNLP